MAERLVRHFILTRFNLFIFNKDKEGHKVRSASWLEHRFKFFERYCLPSIIAQTCQDFEWIVLFDSTTPKRFKERIAEYQMRYSRLKPVYVKPENGSCFAQIFRDQVLQRINSNENESRVITSYLDNDDALNVRFVEDVQWRAETLPNGTFITYDSGYQLFTDYNYVMRICFTRNHFMSVVESGNPATVKTIYGYGSHYYIDKIPCAKIEHVKNVPMWCEVIHEKNMGNDAYFLRAKIMSDQELLRREFAIEETVQSGVGIYLFRFLPRYFKTLFRRIGYFFFGRHW